MTLWYSELRTPMGTWSARTSEDEPNPKGAHGKRTLRAVAQVKAEHLRLSLAELRAIYSPGGPDNTPAAALLPSPVIAAPTPSADDLIRILRAATQYAETVSNEFAAVTASCSGSLVLTATEGGTITLRGLTTARLPVSICLGHGVDGPELHLLQTEAITHEGFAAIRTTELQLRLPPYLARQLTSARLAA